jgi:hypothetical protein
MIRPVCLAAALLLPALPALPALAAGADAIRLCAAEVARTTGRTVSEFDATLRQRLLQGDLVRWPGIVCEVREGKVYALSVDGTPAVSAGWTSAEAKLAYEQLDRETSEAIRTLDTRRTLLAQRLAEAERQLRLPGADIPAVTGYVQGGIDQALGR